jgi:serine/threonine-protein kinase
VPVGRLASSESIDAGGFTPGTVLTERYRIIGLLGSGGMGEVYRADDLKLGQPVALKFLPRNLSEDPVRRERFYSEVRLARQVSHPNVCRVYDVGEIDGQHYLSMEYVDGEDLASLLKRIGRLPSDKALDIARELCAGLAAAHDKAVLHRDLKPSNVMVDGRGRARITDFGLAVAAGEAAPEVSGTPAYMAPEQLAGKGASVRSDIYSLGLVLYELYTGRKAFEGASFQELKRKHSEEPPASPSSVTPQLDPIVERVILRCLEKDPARRPASVAQVAAALPGGDPLAAAVAAGETPSPEMVAAAGEEGALAAPRAWALFGGTLAVVVAILLLAPFSTDLGVAPLPKSSDALYDRAREIAQRFGYGETPADTAFWWERQYEYLRYRADRLPSPRRLRELAAIETHPMWLRYRQSPRPMVPANGGPGGARVRDDDPPLEVSGMVSVAVDARGNLMRFRAVPPQIDESKGPMPAPDWMTLFKEAGLEIERFTPSGPRWLPPMAFDARAEWDGVFARQPDAPVHVTAAAYRGRPVYFEVLGPWDRPLRAEAARPVGILGGTVVAALAISLLVAGSIIARRNLRLGRGDPRGAFRVGAVLLVAYLPVWLLMAHHVADVPREFDMFIISGLSQALFGAGFVWLMYMALEPFVRRRWPHLLISWTRLLSGRFRDPLVGRDCLIGLLAGAVFALIMHVSNGLAAFINLRGMTPIPVHRETLAAPGLLIGKLFDHFVLSSEQALAIMALLILSWVLSRRRWLAVGISAAFVTGLNLNTENLAVDLPTAVLLASLLVFVAIRFGLLALGFTFLVSHLLVSYPLTLDFSRWYAGRSLFVVLIFVGLCSWSFYSSLGGKPVFGGATLEEA